MRSSRIDSKSAGFLRAVRAVLWSFFGVRRGQDYASDAAHLSAWQVIAAGLLAVLGLVLGLVLLVRMLTG